MGENDNCCELCCRRTPDHDLTFLSLRDHHKFYCSRCFNQVIARMYGIQFEHPSFAPVTMYDLDGVLHTFSFRTLLLPTHITIEAIEAAGWRRGYAFQVVGSVDDDIQDLFSRLCGQMDKALCMKYIEDHPDGPRISSKGVVRGRIAWDEEAQESLPMMVIDGRDVRWMDFGRMVASFNGSNFRMEICDGSEMR